MTERTIGRGTPLLAAAGFATLLLCSEVAACDVGGVASASHPSFAHPVPGEIASTFGVRSHPLLNVNRMHNGIDYVAATGDPVAAASGGEVVRAGYEGQFGIAVLVRHPGGWETFYSRLSRPSVKPGDCVKAGEVIGAAGNTGLSTGPGLHFETRKDGAHVDPLSVLPADRKHRG